VQIRLDRLYMGLAVPDRARRYLCAQGAAGSWGLSGQARLSQSGQALLFACSLVASDLRIRSATLAKQP
jgi:hypothetical protein